MYIKCVCSLLFTLTLWPWGNGLILYSSQDEEVNTQVEAIVQENLTLTSDSEVHASDKKVDDGGGESVGLRSSFGEAAKGPEINSFIEVVSQNSGAPYQVPNVAADLVYTVADSATADLQQKVAKLTTSSQNPPQSPTTNLTNQSTTTIVNLHHDHIDANRTNTIPEHILATDTPPEPPLAHSPKTNETDGGHAQAQQQEEIPSFSEWSQKQLEEDAKRNGHDAQMNSSSERAQLGTKKRWKNYASPDCGAKIIAANPEAVSPGSVLTSSRDEYKLNTCTSRIWFIVELCEAIQARKIDLANFELFSSSPRDFTIYVSDRYPTRDWSSVGRFTALDERDIQSFDLHPHLFGKYIKFEMHSHYGAEHYCPISLFRVFGTSEFEVLETESRQNANADDDDDEETLDAESGTQTTNLFSSATDAVMSIVKKAAEVLVNKGNASSAQAPPNHHTHPNYTALMNTCTTPSHIVVCDNCTDVFFAHVFHLLSCQSMQLDQLTRHPIIGRVLRNANVCNRFGLDFKTTSSVSVPLQHVAIVDAFFNPRHVAAMCNLLAITECKVVRNNSVQYANVTRATPIESLTTETTKTRIIETSHYEEVAPPIATTTTSESEMEAKPTAATSPPTPHQIKPTRTLPSDDVNRTHATASTPPQPPPAPKTVDDDEEAARAPPIAEEAGNVSAASVGAQSANVTMDQEQHPVEQREEVVDGGDVDGGDTLEENLEVLVGEMGADSGGANARTTATTTVAPASSSTGQKESVFLRLSNRIKTLERNMSLSTQYLEELSRRYKKQVEEIQRLLDKTILTLSEESKKKDERAQRLEARLDQLNAHVQDLMVARNSWANAIYWLVVMAASFLFVALFCRRPQSKRARTDVEVQRRNSIDVLTHNETPAKRRRPSEVASKIGGTYEDLVYDDINVKLRDREYKKRRKRKSLLKRSNSITLLNDEQTRGAADDDGSRTVNSDLGFSFVPKSTSSRIWKREEPLGVADTKFNYNAIQDIPFALDESEPFTLEPLTYAERLKVNGNVTTTVPIGASSETRTSNNKRQKKEKAKTHQKSASMDESSRKKSPAPDVKSLSWSTDEQKLNASPKKEKRSGLKRIWKTFNFK